MVVKIFPNSESAKKYAEKMNKRSKVYKYVVTDYVITSAGKTYKDSMVIKRRKGK